MPMEIRPEQPSDIATIREITKAAFAPMAYSSQTEAEIVDALRKADALAISLVAIDKDAVIGHVAFSPVTIEGRNLGWYGLGPVSVRPDRQKQGIGGNLIRQGLSQLKEMGAMGCIVLGDPGYYKHFGFENDDALIFEGVPAEYFMRLRLDGPLPAGKVNYHDGFNAT